MATSGVSTYNDTLNSILIDALILVGASGAEDIPSNADMGIAGRYLNRLMKVWEVQGIGSWKTSEGELVLTPGQSKYVIGSGSTDHSSDTVNEVYLTAAAAQQATTLTVSLSDASLVTIGDNIGVALDNNTIFWTTVSNIVTTTITIASGITSTAAVGNRVYDYTTASTRPLDILQIRVRTGTNSDRELTPIDLLQYEALTNKSTTGTPAQFLYKTKLTNAELYFYPTPDSTDLRVKYSYLQVIQDMNNAGDNPDFPQEWCLALTTNVAVQLLPIYGTPPDKAQSIRANAQEALMIARAFDISSVSIFMTPDLDPYY